MILHSVHPTGSSVPTLAFPVRASVPPPVRSRTGAGLTGQRTLHRPAHSGRPARIPALGSQRPAGLPESPEPRRHRKASRTDRKCAPARPPRPQLPAAAPGKSFPRRLPAAPLAAGSSFHMGPAPRSPATRHANRGCPACAATELQRRGLRDVRAPRTPPSSSEAREGGASAPPAPRATCWSPGAVRRGKCPVKRV